MPRLIPCPACHSHVHLGDSTCPHCGESVRTTEAPRAAAALVGLALTACPVVEPEPDYGVPDSTTAATETATPSDSETSSESGAMTDTGTTGAGTETDTGTESATGDSTAGEPEYGVAETEGAT